MLSRRWLAALLIELAMLLMKHQSAVADSKLPTADLAALRAISCAGTYRKHLQGICTNNTDSIYWCFTDALVKTDLEGKEQRRVPVADHHGDLCYHDGKIFVAVNLGEFNKPAGKAKSSVYVYDADSLKELAQHPTPELVHGAGGIAHHAGRFIVVGGLPEGINENYLYEYDESFVFQKRHTLDSGYTLMGIQTVTFANEHWWFGCYGKPQVLLKADKTFKLVGKWEFDASLGIADWRDGKLLVASGRCDKTTGCIGQCEIAAEDKLTVVESRDTKSTDKR